MGRQTYSLERSFIQTRLTNAELLSYLNVTISNDLGAKMKDDEERRKIAKICDEKGIPVTCVMPKQDEFIMQDCLRKPGCLLEKN